MNRKSYTAAVLIALTALGNTASRGATVVSNLSTSEASAWDLGPAGGDVGVANSFTTSTGAGWTLDSIVLSLVEALGPNPPVPDQNVTVSLYDDAGGEPGSVVGTFNSMVPAIPGTVTFTPTTTVNLTANTTYWVYAEYPEEDEVYWSNTSDLTETGLAGWEIGNDALTLTGGSWNVLLDDTPTRFEINATTIPEPTSALLVGLGGAFLGVGRRRIKSGTQKN